MILYNCKYIDPIHLNNSTPYIHYLIFLLFDDWSEISKRFSERTADVPSITNCAVKILIPCALITHQIYLRLTCTFKASCENNNYLDTFYIAISNYASIYSVFCKRLRFSVINTSDWTCKCSWYLFIEEIPNFWTHIQILRFDKHLNVSNCFHLVILATI